MDKQIARRGAGFEISNRMGGLDGCYCWDICILVYVGRVESRWERWNGTTAVDIVLQKDLIGVQYRRLWLDSFTPLIRCT